MRRKCFVDKFDTVELEASYKILCFDIKESFVINITTLGWWSWRILVKIRRNSFIFEEHSEFKEQIPL